MHSGADNCEGPGNAGRCEIPEVAKVSYYHLVGGVGSRIGGEHQYTSQSIEVFKVLDDIAIFIGTVDGDVPLSGSSLSLCSTYLVLLA